MSADPRITRDAVLDAIYNPTNRRRTIWTPSTTLTAMGIECYPHLPQVNYRKMARVLQELHDQEWLVLRPQPHSRFTMKEVAYERAEA